MTNTVNLPPHPNRVFYGAVAAGSVIGSLLRWGAGLAFQACLGGAFPCATLFVNVTGSFAIGWFGALSSPNVRMRQFVMTGICGGYTTFSMFSLETLRFLQASALGTAGLYMAASLVTWIGAVWAGDALGRRLGRR